MRISDSRRSAKNTVATCRVPAETMPPLAATAAASVGSNALPSTSSCSIVSVPAPIMVCTSPAAVMVMTSTKDKGTKLTSKG